MRIDWKDKEVLQKVSKATEIASKKGAEIVLQKSKSAVPVGKTGDLKESIKKKKSKYKDGGYVVGVFFEMAGKWQDTIGARAIFIEYGHAAPGDARGAKVTRPQSFLRKPLNQSKRKIRQEFKKVFKRIDGIGR